MAGFQAGSAGRGRGTATSKRRATFDSHLVKSRSFKFSENSCLIGVECGENPLPIANRAFNGAC